MRIHALCFLTLIILIALNVTLNGKFDNEFQVHGNKVSLSYGGVGVMHACMHGRLDKADSSIKPFDQIDRSSENEISSPLSIDFYPSFQCNQSCFFCYVPNSVKRSLHSPMSYNLAVKMLSKLVDSNVFELSILGGEPLLMSWMKNFLVDAVAVGLKVDMTTNGTGITKEIAEKMLNLKHFSLNVSLHGHNALLHDYHTGMQGSFQGVVNACIMLQDLWIGNSSVLFGNQDKCTQFMRLTTKHFQLRIP